MRVESQKHPTQTPTRNLSILSDSVFISRGLPCDAIVATKNIIKSFVNMNEKVEKNGVTQASRLVLEAL